MKKFEICAAENPPPPLFWPILGQGGGGLFQTCWYYYYYLLLLPPYSKQTPPLDPERGKIEGGGGFRCTNFKIFFNMSEDEHEKKSLGKSIEIPDMSHIFQLTKPTQKKLDFF